jgi:hypothetical protein
MALWVKHRKDAFLASRSGAPLPPVLPDGRLAVCSGASFKYVALRALLRWVCLQRVFLFQGAKNPRDLLLLKTQRQALCVLRRK